MSKQPVNKPPATKRTRPFWYGLLLLAIGVVGACSPRIPAAPPVTLDAETTPELCSDTQTGAEMSLGEALEIAGQSACAQEGEVAATGTCNANTGTWWIDLNADRPGCNPACVVNLNSRTAEVNWRCTGLATPEADAPTLPANTGTSEAPAPTAVPTEGPSPTSTLEPLPDWAKYTNETYGFTFHYPITWTIELLTNRPEMDNRAQAVRLTHDNLELLVEYRMTDETLMIGPDSLPEGEVTEQGTVTLLDRAVPKYILQQEGQDIVIFVGEQFVDLELYIQIRTVNEEGAPEALPQSAREEFDTFIDTFKRTGETAIDPYPGWVRYARSGDATSPGFVFRYPPDWSLDESSATGDGAATLNLYKDTLRISMQVTNGGDEMTLGPDPAPSGMTADAGTASFLGAAVPRQVTVQEGKLKVVFVHYRDETLKAYLALTGNPDQISYDNLDLSQSARDLMDHVVASFELTED